MRQYENKNKKFVHNTYSSSKKDLRNEVKQSFGAGACRVLETHCGPGTMRDESWHDVASVYGIDLDPYSVSECIGDSKTFLRREDLHQWNVFDIDPFGDYAEFLWLVSQRRRINEPIAILCTDGMAGGGANTMPTMKKRGASRQVLDALGLAPQDGTSSVRGIRGSLYQFGELLTSFFPDASVVSRWNAVSHHGQVCYHAAIIAPPDSTVSGLIKPAGRG
jgi:hypothetical protein